MKPIIDLTLFLRNNKEFKLPFIPFVLEKDYDTLSTLAVRTFGHAVLHNLNNLVNPDIIKEDKVWDIGDSFNTLVTPLLYETLPSLRHIADEAKKLMACNIPLNHEPLVIGWEREIEAIGAEEFQKKYNVQWITTLQELVA